MCYDCVIIIHSKSCMVSLIASNYQYAKHTQQVANLIAEAIYRARWLAKLTYLRNPLKLKNLEWSQ